jgi:hypothetical protein
MSARIWVERLAWLLALGVLFSSGCNRRQHYRLQADRDAQYLVEEKSNDSRWALSNFNITLDSRSRFYDHYPVDGTPMPMDDPASHVFMRRVNGMKGWPKWEKWGYRDQLDNPNWRESLSQYVRTTESGALVLDLDSALRLAYMHSPDQQQQLETIYLSALDVSTERFRLQTQFFGRNDTTYDHGGTLRARRFLPPPATGFGDSNRLTSFTNLGFQRRFATAGTLLVDFANTFVWTFSGTDTNSASSLIDVALVQPLLRGAGRDVQLEQLTIVERGLLANLRAYQRYRHGFFTNVAIGESGVSGPQRRGGFFGGTGLTGFTGTGTGGLGGVGQATGFGRGGFGAGGGGAGGGAGFAGGGAGQVGGFIGLLQSLQQIRNSEVSLESQIRTLSLLEANLEAGIIDLTQVDQFRQNIETERATLLQSRNGLTNSIESYLTGTLGLPPDVRIELDDQLIRQFQLLDSRTTAAQNALEDLQDELGSFADVPTMDRAEAIFNETEGLLDEVDQVVRNTDADVEMMMQRMPQRMQVMTPDERQTFEQDIELLQSSLEELKARLARTRPDFEQIRQQATPDNLRQTVDGMVTWLRNFISLVQEFSLVQARARVESIYVDPLEMDAQTAFRLARSYRLDLMNNRAALVDSWRLIQFNADALQSNLGVFINGNVGTVGKNPLDFRSQNSTVRAGVQFEAPFQRLLERNNYRQQLIEYQQDRRQLIQFYDNVYRSLRVLIRDMEQLRLNLEIQRRAVVIAIRRVDLTREDLNEPTAPPAPGEPASQLGPTAATNLLTALSDLRNTQNNFMSVWLNYYADQMRLARDTGLMQLDENGKWIETPLKEAEPLPEEELELPPSLREEWIKDAFDQEGENPRKFPPTEPMPAGVIPVSAHASVSEE